MKYRLLCIDLDGTLLTDDKKIKKQDIKALQMAADQGIKIALITSRMPAVTEPIAKILEVPSILACSAGACIMEEGTYLYAEYLQPEALGEIYEGIKPLGIPLSIYRDRQWFVTGRDRFVTAEEEIVHYLAESASMEELVPRWKKEGKGPNKLLIGAETELVEKVCRLLQNRRDVEIARISPNHVDIFPKGMNKGAALCVICEKKGIRKEETIAFGDQEPDISMLEAAGIAVAMGNAIDELKEKADYITKTNNEAGIAYALHHYLHII